MSERTPDAVIARIEISGRLDRHAIEAIRLEVRRLARQYGVEVKEVGR